MAPPDGATATTARSAPPVYEPAEFWDTRLRDSFDVRGAGYKSLGLPFNEALYRQREAVLRRALRRFRIPVSGRSVLELGPGTGFYVGIWQRLGVGRLLGLDIAAVSVERLAERFPEFEFRQTDLRRPWSTGIGQFDIVTAFDVLFHIVDDADFAAAIRECANATRSGGHLLISDLFPHGRAVRVTHQASRLLGDYERVLGENGFEVLGRLPIFVTMHPPYDVAPGRLERLAWRWWRWLEQRLKRDRESGARLGRYLRAVDAVATRLVRDGPSTELLVARRR